LAPGGLVNGSRGAVVDWIPANEIPEEYANQGFPDGQDDIFMEEQAEQFFPLVYFSNETMGESSLGGEFSNLDN
jgi:hypothetical protein